jgi:hypothetical protein
VDSKIDKTVGVSPLIVIPGDNLVEGIVKRNACISINNRRAAVMYEVLRHNSVISVSKNSLQFTLRSSLKSSKKLFLGASLLGLDCKINHRNIRGRTTDSHTSKKSVQFRDDNSNSLGGSSGRGDKVGNGGTVKRNNVVRCNPSKRISKLD